MKQKRKAIRRQPEEEPARMLDDYDEVLDLLEDMLQEFNQLQAEIIDAVDDIQDSLGDAGTRLAHCRINLKRIQPFTNDSYVEEAPILPFDA